MSWADENVLPSLWWWLHNITHLSLVTGLYAYEGFHLTHVTSDKKSDQHLYSTFKIKFIG